MLPPEELQINVPLRIANPISVTHEYLRTSLRGSLLETLERNLRRPDRAEVAIFEVARAYHRVDGDLPEEDETVVGVIAGRRPDRWGMPSEEPLDFFDAKGYLEALFDGLRVPVDWQPAEEFGFLPGRCATIAAGDAAVGVLGQVHPSVLTAFDIERDVFLFELRLAALSAQLPERLTFQPVSRFESVRRDLALVVDADLPAAVLQRAIAATTRVVAVRPFDEYRGAPLPPGKKSLAFALSFQAPDRTLTDEEVDRAIERLLRGLEREFSAFRR